MRVLVAIPVFNEARYLPRVIEAVRRHHAGDVLFVDDGSTDRTAAVLGRTAGIEVIRHSTNRGYGQSLIDAFAYAAAEQYDWVITLDCDEQHEPARIEEFVAAAAKDNADIISGSRYLTDMAGNSRPPADRQRINGCITSILNSTLGLSLTDSFCGFKAHRVDALRRLNLTVPGYAFPLQFWVQVASAQLRVREIPVALIYNDPNRHFGGALDDSDARLNHYLAVFSDALAEAGLICHEDCFDPAGRLQNCE